MKIRTMRGKEIDIGAIMAQNEEVVAIGNANMNARGDIVGLGGKIVKRKEQIVQEYHNANPRGVRHVGLKDISADVFATPSEAVAEIVKKNAEQSQKTSKTNKKIVDND